jgi:hypothetical protein
MSLTFSIRASVAEAVRFRLRSVHGCVHHEIFKRLVVPVRDALDLDDHLATPLCALVPPQRRQNIS